MSPISLSTSVAGIEVSFSPAASARIDRAIEASGRTVRRTTKPAARMPISTPMVPSTMLCQFASVSVRAKSRDSTWPRRALTSRSSSVTRPISRPSVPSTSLSISAICRSRTAIAMIALGIVIDRRAQRGIVDRPAPACSAPPVRPRTDYARAGRARSGSAPPTGGGQLAVGGAGDRRVELVAQRRQAASSSARRSIRVEMRSMPLR